MWFSKKVREYVCTGCRHVIGEAPYKLMDDGFHPGKSPYCFTCAPRYDRIKQPRMSGFGDTSFFKNDVPCDSEGVITCYKCDESQRAMAVLSKELTDMTIDYNKKLAAARKKTNARNK